MDLRARSSILLPPVGEGLGEGKPAKGRPPVIFGTALRPLDSVIDKVASVWLSEILVALRPRDSIACHFGLNIKGISGLRSIVPYRLLIFSSQLVSGRMSSTYSRAPPARWRACNCRRAQRSQPKEAVPMADEILASIIPLHQPKKKAKSGAQRARTQRQRKRQKAKAPASPNNESASSEPLIPEGFSPVDSVFAEPPAAPLPTVTFRAVARDEDAPSRSISPILLRAAALALAGVGIAMNGWFARSLGASDAAGWLFFATGVASDLVALVAPSCSARLWQARHRATSLAGWAVWAMTFVFAVTAGVGFASTNIADVTLVRASRVTPAVAAAQAALSDAMAARDRECKGGVGKFCREREAAVNERRQALDTAMQAVGQTADPQTEAAIRIVAWASHGALQPTSSDFAMLRLVLLAMLPQIGGILLMVGRSATRRG